MGSIFSMYCSACSAATHVLDTRPAGDAVRRRRECKTCGARFTTYERDSGAAELEGAVIKFVRGLDATPTTEAATR